ncbi:MAG: tyrosine-type recombinase/integrase [Thermoguttaceae bacterium]|jgi:integrase
MTCTLDEIRAMVAAASVPLKVMILLGINCGFGNTDVANLTVKNLDLKDGWCNYPRPKTGISRRCPLWPETVKAIKAAPAVRPASRDKADTDLVFLTPDGQRWVWTRGTPADIDATDMEELARISRADRVTAAMGQLLSRLGLARPGHTFYTLRHTFETIGGESRDQVAVDAIMGHSREDMASVYRERIGDDRVRAVVEHVRQWLLEKPLERKGRRMRKD